MRTVRSAPLLTAICVPLLCLVVSACGDSESTEQTSDDAPASDATKPTSDDAQTTEDEQPSAGEEQSFSQALKSGASCSELFDIRNEVDPKSPLIEEMNEQLGAVGCGSSGSERTDQPGEDQPGGFTGLYADTYKRTKSVCKSLPLREIAKDLGLPASSDEFTVAEEFSEGSTDAHRQAAFEGCLAGIEVP